MVLSPAPASGYTMGMATSSHAAAPRGAFDIGAETALGGRPDNQDRSEHGGSWVVLSDGMGGYAGGARAAELTVAAAASALKRPTRDPASAVVEAIRLANAAVRRGRRDDPAVAEMGATVTVAMAAAGEGWLVANLGDSPAWVVRAGETELVTEAHNVAGEMVRQGVLDPSEADRHPGSHVLLRGAGLDDDPRPFVRLVTVAAGERLVVASDGLAGGLDATGLHRLLGPPQAGSAAEDARLLVDAAVAGGATDNVTVVVIRA